jgi:hypothetical protein
MNRRHLERVLRVFADHDNAHRPHRSLNLIAPEPTARKLRVLHAPTGVVERRDRLGTLQPQAMWISTSSATPPRIV